VNNLIPNKQSVEFAKFVAVVPKNKKNIVQPFISTAFDQMAPDATFQCFGFLP